MPIRPGSDTLEDMSTSSRTIFGSRQFGVRRLMAGRVRRVTFPALITLAWLVLDRAAAGYARGLVPGATPMSVLGDWLSVQRVDHASSNGPSMLLMGAVIFAGVTILAQFDEVPGKHLAMAAFACTAAGLSANGLSLLIQDGAVIDFLTVQMSSDVASALFAFVPGQALDGRAMQTMHFVPADLALWSGSVLTMMWLAVMAVTSVISALSDGLRRLVGVSKTTT